jgi:replicative DNA helicase
MLSKIPPQALDAEESLLSALLVYPENLEECDGIISPQDFYKTGHGKIFGAIQGLYADKQPIDLITVVEQLSKSKALAEVGGAAYLSRLTDTIPPSVNSIAHAKIIRDKSLLRQLINRSMQIVENCYSNKPVDDVLANAQKDINEIEVGGDDSFTTMSELSHESLDRYEKQAEESTNGTVSGVRVGLRELDAVTGGFRGSKLIIVAGRPGMGKTAFALTVARNIARDAHKVGIISMEMDKEELDDRFLAMESGLNTMKLSQGQGPETDEWKYIVKASSTKSTWPILIDDSGGMDINKLKRKCRAMVKQGCEIIFIDQLSFIEGDRSKTPWLIASESTNAIARLKKELRTPIVLLAQLNRELEKRSDKEPILSDLKNTGNLEEDADIVVLLYRPEMYNTTDPELKGISVINIAKNRSGPTWRSTSIKYIAKQTLFKDGGYP